MGNPKSSGAFDLSSQRVLRHHWKLRMIVRDWSLETLALEVASRIALVRRAVDNERGRLLSRWPPHLLLDLVEMCAAETRIVGPSPISERQLQSALELHRRFDNPIDKHLLVTEQNFALWWMRLNREQFDIQHRAGLFDIGRVLRLLWDDAPLKSVSAAMTASLGLSVEDWVAACFVCWAMTRDKPNPNFVKKYLAEIPEHFISQDRMDRALKLLAATPAEMGERYRRNHPVNRPREWSSASSAFLERPMLSFEKGWIAPCPDLLLLQAASGVHTLASQIDPRALEEELGVSLERYVGDLFGLLRHRRQALGGKTLRDWLHPLKACDHVFEFDDSILLVECKAIQRRTRHLSVNAWRGSGDVGAIADGFSQIWATAQAVCGGRLAAKGISSDKPVFGAVITFGQFPALNDARFRKEVVFPRLPADMAGWPSPLRAVPLVLGPRALDLLAVWLSQEERGPSALFENWYERAPLHGDGEHFLQTLVQARPNPIASFWSDPFDRLWAKRFELIERNRDTGQDEESSVIP